MFLCFHSNLLWICHKRTYGCFTYNVLCYLFIFRFCTEFCSAHLRNFLPLSIKFHPYRIHLPILVISLFELYPESNVVWVFRFSSILLGSIDVSMSYLSLFTCVPTVLSRLFWLFLQDIILLSFLILNRELSKSI